MSSTALGAKPPKTKKIIFISEAHEKFYYPIYLQINRKKKRSIKQEKWIG